MELQLAQLPLAVEVQIISAFVLVILGTEILVILFTHLRKNPESGVALIRACSIGVAAVVAMKIVEFAYLVLQGTDVLSRDIVYGLNLIIIDLGCTAIFAALRHFTRPRPVLFRFVMPLMIAISILATILHGVELLSARPASIVPNVVSVGFTAPIAFAPASLVLFLHAQSDRAIKPYYKCIIFAVALLGFGGMLHLVPVEDVLVAIGVGLSTSAIASMAFSIAGVAIFFVTLFMMPYIEDLDWRKEVVAVYLVNTGTGRILFKRSFEEKNHVASSGSINSESDSVLMGGLSGMEEFVREMTNNTAGNLEFIDKDGLKFMLSRFKQFLFIAIARANLPVIRAKLLEFKATFITRFGEVVKGKAVGESQHAGLKRAADIVFKGRSMA
jgi:hypothetical protein